MIIELLNGQRLDISDYGLKRLYHYIPSASIDHNSVSLESRSDIIVNSKINKRTITVELLFQSRDIFDYYAIRDEVNALFLRDESYYIIFKNEPHKRWLVRCQNGYNVNPNKRIGSFEIEFVTLNSYAESIATTQTLKEWDIDSWSWNGAINWDEENVYTFNTNSFVVNNVGTAKVDPRSSQLIIRSNHTTNTFFQMINRTTNEIYEYYGGLSDGEILEINGIDTRVNNVSRFSRTNRRLITLAPGENIFEIFGADINEISFDFRFLYK